jgi:hypothetical protein
LNHAPFGLIGRFADGLGNFPRLAGAVTDTASTVANDDQGAEGKPAATLDDFGDTVDVHQFVEKIVAFIALKFAITSASATTAAASATGTATLLR